MASPCPSFDAQPIRPYVTAAVKKGAVMVYHGRAVYDFHASVAVHIRRGKAVVPLPRQTSIFGIRPFQQMDSSVIKRI